MNTENLIYGTMEHWSAGECSMVPVLYRTGEAWALIDGTWREMNSGEICMTARTLDRESFDNFFGVLTELPAEAFQ